MRDLFKLLALALATVALLLAASQALAHPGHGAQLHGHPEVWALLVVVYLVALVIGRR